MTAGVAICRSQRLQHDYYFSLPLPEMRASHADGFLFLSPREPRTRFSGAMVVPEQGRICPSSSLDLPRLGSIKTACRNRDIPARSWHIFDKWVLSGHTSVCDGDSYGKVSLELLPRPGRTTTFGPRSPGDGKKVGVGCRTRTQGWGPKFRRKAGDRLGLESDG